MGDSFQLTTESTGTKIVTGRFSPALFESDSSFVWYHQHYDSFRPDSSSIAFIASSSTGLHFIVFGGTWCGDTKRELPKFFKTLALAHVDLNSVELYGVDRSKVSHDGLTEKYNVSRVPTFIILSQGKEIGRIVETTNEGMERDLAGILKGK